MEGVRGKRHSIKTGPYLTHSWPMFKHTILCPLSPGHQQWSQRAELGIQNMLWTSLGITQSTKKKKEKEGIKLGVRKVWEPLDVSGVNLNTGYRIATETTSYTWKYSTMFNFENQCFNKGIYFYKETCSIYRILQ